MIDDVDSAYRVVDAFVAPQLALDDLDVEPFEIRSVPGREVVEDAHLVAAVEEGAREVRSDEAGATRDEDARHQATASTWKFAFSEPGIVSRSSGTARSRPSPGGVQADDERHGEEARMRTLCEEVDSVRYEHRDRGCGPGTGPHRNGRPFGICSEQTLEARARPAPEIVRVRVEGIDAVRREQHPAARLHDPPQLAHRRCGLRHVLENLQAEHDVEARVLDGDRVDRAVHVGVRVAGHVEADDRRSTCKQRFVRPLAAADVEHVDARELLRGQPLEERLPNRIADGRARRVEAAAHSSTSLGRRHAEGEEGHCIERDSGHEPCALQSQTSSPIHASASEPVSCERARSASQAATAKTAAQSASPMTPRSASAWIHTFWTP